jgi:hypothetical protein
MSKILDHNSPGQYLFPRKEPEMKELKDAHELVMQYENDEFESNEIFGFKGPFDVSEPSVEHPRHIYITDIDGKPIYMILKTAFLGAAQNYQMNELFKIYKPTDKQEEQIKLEAEEYEDNLYMAYVMCLCKAINSCLFKTNTEFNFITKEKYEMALDLYRKMVDAKNHIASEEKLFNRSPLFHINIHQYGGTIYDGNATFAMFYKPEDTSLDSDENKWKRIVFSQCVAESINKYWFDRCLIWEYHNEHIMTKGEY